MFKTGEVVGPVMSVSEEVEVSDREKKALQLIEEEEGIHQMDFWKEMDVSSRTGSRIINGLLEKELVEREETIYSGQNTYFITLAPKAPEELDFSLLMAGDMITPFVGDEQIDTQSDEFSQWVMNLAYEEY